MSIRGASWLVAAVAALGLVMAGAGVVSGDGKGAKKPKKLNKLKRDAVRADNSILHEYIKGMGKDVKGQTGSWSFKFEGMEVMVVTDERADRMRVISPIIEVKDASRDVLLKLLEANFDRALDAKYSVYKGAVWAVYTHPLSPITKGEFVSAVKQVVALVKNYGTTYASLDVVFGGGGSP